MNFLQLAQRLHTESGVQGATHTTVVGQTGLLLKLVNWISTANDDIQNLYPKGWKFLQKAFSFPTVATQYNYDDTDAGITYLGDWKTDDVRVYSAAADECELVYVPWDTYRLVYRMGTNRTQTGRPTVFSIMFDMSIELWPIPDAVYTINGEYWMSANTMAVADASAPLFPSQYHMAIVWRALMLYAAKQGADEVYAHGNNEYNKILRRLEINQLYSPTWGPPLA